MKQRSIISHEPTGWGRATRYLSRGSQARWMGFTCSTADLPRFRARYRAAHAFDGISMESYGASTASAYAAMIKLTLTWSAFEYFVRLIGIPKSRYDQLQELADKHRVDDILNGLRSDDCLRLFEVVANGLDQDSHKRRVRRFLEGEVVNPVFLASGIRHSFAHGYLSPGSRKQGTIKACNMLSGLLFSIMDTEFGGRIREYHEREIERAGRFSRIEHCGECEWHDTSCQFCGGSGFNRLDERRDDEVPWDDDVPWDA